MPLRSVEAASREDAIAAAREQFGPATRVVGVRRVRSGGVLGFFATERYVAEVAPDPLDLPGVPVPTPARPAGALTEDPDTGSLAAFGSPLASAAPARARTAPPRNGAAAWAAEAARPSASAAAAIPALVGASSAAGRPVDAARSPYEPADDIRVEELASLLSGASAPPVASTAVAASRGGVAPASFPRATRGTPATFRDDDVLDALAAPAADTPSPFTAALARMVAGDREVQQAVRAALETADAARPAEERSGFRASPSGPEATSQSTVWSRAPHQEEETVGDQVITLPSTSTDEQVEFASWATEPPFTTEPFTTEPFTTEPFTTEAFTTEPFTTEAFTTEAYEGSQPPVSREEAIAKMLRAALAEGHSDDALADILRKVVAGDSPETALAEPAASATAEFAAAQAMVELQDAELQDAELQDVERLEIDVPTRTVAESPVTETPVIETPVAVGVAAQPADELLPETAVEPLFDLFSPMTRPAAVVPAAPAAVPVQLWGEVFPTPVVAPIAAAGEPVPATDGSIWAETTTGAAASEILPAGEADSTEVQSADSARVETVSAEAATESTGSALDLEVAPVLARTASDPAPLSGSLAMDATTVMPPLSLLPGSASRNRGLPPVPPRTSRPAVPPSRGRLRATPPAGPDEPSSGADTVEEPSSSGRTPDVLATVTRLPIPPLIATPEKLGMLGFAGPADLIETDGSNLSESADSPAGVPARPTRVRIAPPSTAAEVVSRLAELGVPADLLGATFTADVAIDGTYAALTRALAERLPETPELPTGAGDVLFVVGSGVETLRAARSLAATLRLDPDRVQWATRGDLVGMAPESSRMSTIDTALRRRQDASTSGTVTIVAVDAPLRADASWVTQLLAVWSPIAVWAVAESTRKPEDVGSWLDGLDRVDALIVQDTDLSADPAAVLHHRAAPVAVVDGARATPHRWASVLCERLESAPA